MPLAVLASFLFDTVVFVQTLSNFAAGTGEKLDTSTGSFKYTASWRTVYSRYGYYLVFGRALHAGAA